MASVKRAVLTVMVMLCISILVIMPVSTSAGEPETTYIAEGGHYAAGPFYVYSEADLRVNMTVVDGGNVDIYIMTMTQYENSYPVGSSQPLAVSYKDASIENVTSANIHYRLNATSETEYFGEAMYVIVDNRDCALTPGDANPEGRVTVRIEVDYSEDYYYPFDDIENYSFLLCTMVPIITIVVILSILVYALKRSEEKNRPPQFPMPYPMPPPEPPKTV